MGIAIEAPRGGLAEKIGEASYPLVLRNAEIERFEDKHRGIFELWDGFFGRSTAPTSTEVRDLIALGLVGAGMKDAVADKLVLALGPDQLLGLFAIGRALIGIAFMPDAGDVKKKQPKKPRKN